MRPYILIIALVFSINSAANVRLPKLFSDDMVLQRDHLIPIWGWANANEKIEIRFNKQLKSTKADKNGKWIVRLDAENAGGPYELSIKGKNHLILKNVLVGEVWICSGQSNMEFTVNEAMNAEKEINDADYPFIRHFKVERDVSSLPKDDVKSGKWEVSTKKTVGNFTAVGYFFAKKLYEELKIPIGLINTSWGGTGSETWTSREAFESSEEFASMIAEMPKVNLDSISQIFIKSITKRIETLQGSKIDSDNTAQFKELEFDDVSWPEINQPELWETQELGEFDGVVWLRKTITLSTEDTGKAGMLELSKIDDEDISFINGIEVGRNNIWDAKRKYPIPLGLLKAGENTIAIRVVDGGGGGGIYGDTSDFKLTVGNNAIPLTGKWKYQVESVKSDISPNSYPSLLYNAMVNPLIPFAIQGVLWYQGETNAWRAQQYKKAFPLMISDWRNKWHQGNFPFYFVQLSSFNETNGNSNNGSMWAELREAQTETLQLPNTGMCVTTDNGDPLDIHPKNKQDVGKRLAAIALSKTYKKNIVYSGPTFISMEIQENKIIVSFENIGSGLSTPDKYGYVKGFEIAGDDQIFYYAKAKIVDDKVVIYNENVKNPVAIHFGWADDASDNNLYNKEGFPAVPFRTDKWKNVTDTINYRIVQ
ncbi:MAG TPA: sialate O-acetylesterase [Lutibacter sp.]|nr:sialate O-acetylesterase [Lutibacter sp.]